jgi:hypothetical protein
MWTEHLRILVHERLQGMNVFLATEIGTLVDSPAQCW